MVVKLNNMEKQVRSELKGGKGDIHFLNCVSKDTIPNCRLLSYMTIPPEGSIGEHEHVEETECYVIKSGKGVVIDNGKKIDISAGDVVITGTVHFMNSCKRCRTSSGSLLIIQSIQGYR